MNDSPITILLVDDHPVVRDGYKLLIENTGDMTVIAEASDGDEAYRQYVEHHPDIVITDLSMPGIGGLEVIRRIVQRDPDAKVMVFSVHEGPVHVVRAKEAGAKGYVSKRCASQVVLDAVRALSKGDTYFAPVSEVIADATIPQFKEAVDPFESLTAREFEVCRLLAEGNAVISVADTLHISPSTVGVHQTRILHKLHVKNSAQLARLAMRYGLVEP